jgi:hypothetical protein
MRRPRSELMASRKTAKRTKRVKSAPKKPKLLWLKIHKLRHVEPCELRFNDGFNVLLGLNATGKTTLLELIAAALRFNFVKLKHEEFHIEYELSLDGGNIIALIKNEKLTAAEGGAGSLPKARMSRSIGSQGPFVATTSADPMLEPSVELRLLTDLEGQYALKADKTGTEIEGEGKTGSSDLDVRDCLFNGQFVMLAFSTFLNLGSVEALVPLFVNALSFQNTRRFDESLSFLRYIVGKLHYAVLSRSRESHRESIAYGNGPLPSSVIDEVNRESEQWQMPNVASGISISGERVELLATMATMLGFDSVQLQMTHLGTEVTGKHERIRFGSFRFMLQRRDGSVISHDLLSYGQKRVLAFLYYLEGSPNIVIADELVDGLHHSWIEDCIKAVGDRQVFLASQNPLLLDYLEFDSAEKVGRSFIQCRVKREKAADRMSWSNLSEVEAGRFFDAYQVGLQHVSEILRTKGLW